jgi:2-aminoethylphosphonate-pyruvate transaminase
MKEICNSFQIDHIYEEVPWGKPLDLTKLERLLEENGEKISHLAFVHHETTVGILNPLEDISHLGQKYQVGIIMDAMSSYAGVDINLKKNPVDFLISSANKCLHAMPGLSFVLCRKKALEKTSGLTPKNFYLNLYSNYLFQENKKQFQFTPPVQILYSLAQALEEHFTLTTQGKIRHYGELYFLLLKGMKTLGFGPLVEEKHHSKLITAFNEPDLPGFDFEKMHDFLKTFDITIYPGKIPGKKTFRVANIGDLTKEDISLYLEKLKSYMDTLSPQGI